MHYSHYIGVDISKNTLDAAIYAAEMRRSDTKHLTNDKAGLKELVTWAKAAGARLKDMLICAETHRRLRQRTTDLLREEGHCPLPGKPPPDQAFHGPCPWKRRPD